jgi:hypothetical protein
MTTVVISQPFLFPWVGHFEQIQLADIYVHYDDVAFSKGSFVNRVQLKNPDGWEWMTIPLRARKYGQQIRELVDDDRHAWRDQHCRRLEQLYRDAPFYAEMLHLVEELYAPSHSRLSDLLAGSIEAVARYFGLAEKTRFVRSSELAVAGSSSERVLAIVQRLGGDRYVTGQGARHYLQHSLFEAAGVAVEYLDYQRVPYPQRFGTFNPHVSILDLIANQGKAGLECIRSPSVSWREFLGRFPAADAA